MLSDRLILPTIGIPVVDRVPNRPVRVINLLMFRCNVLVAPGPPRSVQLRLSKCIPSNLSPSEDTRPSLLKCRSTARRDYMLTVVIMVANNSIRINLTFSPPVTLRPVKCFRMVETTVCSFSLQLADGDL